MRENNIGMIIFGFFVLAVLVVGGLYIYHVSRYNYFPIKEGTKIIPITNKTDIQHDVYHNSTGIPVTLEPDETKNFHIDYYDHLSAVGRHEDGLTMQHEYQFTNDTVNNLYLTLDGFRSNLSASHGVTIHNDSNYPISFIQTSTKGGSKWHIITVGPKSKSIDHFIGHGSLIYVAYASAPHLPVAETQIGTRYLTKITFDGEKIYVE